MIISKKRRKLLFLMRMNLVRFSKIEVFLKILEKSGTREKSEPEKTNEKDTKNESMLNQSVLNQSENNGENNQSVLNQSHNMSLNQSLNQSVASCLICYEKLPDAVLMECGHGGSK